MNKLTSLTKRNIKLFFASKSNIFFSTLALIILVLLHFIVLRKMNADSFISAGLPIDEKWAFWFSDSLMLSSLIPISAITISLTSLCQIVTDKEKNIINDFYVAPVSRTTMLISYLLSSFIIGAIMLLGLVAFIQIYLMVMYGVSFTVVQLLSILGVTMLSLLLGNSFVMLIVSFVKREQAMGAIGTILGTMLGFFCGAYVPIGVLGEGITKLFTALPFLPITSLARQAFFMNITKTELTKEMIGGPLAKMYGYELYFNDEKLSTLTLILIVLAFIILFSMLLVLIFKKMRKKD
ncbi:MAG: ABC transporter permease [Clostridia bacterium]